MGLDEEYARLIDDVARSTAARPAGLAAAQTLEWLQLVRGRIAEFSRREGLARERRACLRAAMTTIDHTCRELRRWPAH